MTGEGAIICKFHFLCCHNKACRSTRILTAKIPKKWMDVFFISMFGLLIEADETKMATQNDEMNEIHIKRHF